MAKLAVPGPLDERHLHDDSGMDPVRPKPRQSGPLREWRLGDFNPVKPRAKVAQELRIESGTDLPGEDEIAVREVADEQCAKTYPPTLRVGEPADDELLRRLAFHLQPVRRPPVLVRRAAAFCHNAFPAFLACPLPRLRI